MSLLNANHYKLEYDGAMEVLRPRVLGGDRQALFTAMELFFRGSHLGVAQVCPPWLAHAALIPLNEVAEGKHEHMEHAFGFSIKQTQGFRATRIDGKRVYEAVELAHQQGHAITHDGAFAIVGDKLGMSTSTVERRYRDYQKRVKDSSHDRSNEMIQDFDRKYGDS